MPNPKPSRHDEIRALAAQGFKPPEIAAKLGVHRQTVWRHTRGFTPPPSTVERNGSPASNNGSSDGNNDVDDWGGITSEVVAKMRELVQGGNVAAAVQLVRLSTTEARRTSDVVTGEKMRELLLAHFEVWRNQLIGPVPTSGGARARARPSASRGDATGRV